MIKKILKKILPSSLIKIRQDRFIRKKNNSFYQYDIKMFEKFSSIFEMKTEKNFEGKLILLYHVIEKGITMPAMKEGFGQPKVEQLIDLCFEFKKKFSDDNFHFRHAIGVLSEYFKVNKNFNDVNLINIEKKYFSLIKDINNVIEVSQFNVTREEYFRHAKSDFKSFALSRKSLRNFTKGVDINDVYKAIDLAQTAPSTCNRQPTRVHIIKDIHLQEKVLDIQKGNRGFGHLVDITLIITADLSIYGTSEERFSPFVDGGIYTMNILYALHYYKIGACPLNWSKSPDDDMHLRKIVAIPDNETVIVVIACGNLPDEFKIANSPRTPYSAITKLH
jgi:nitroreductase